MHEVHEFVTSGTPSLHSYWRSIILFGDNVATYKFALGKSLLELAAQGKSYVPLNELAIPFAYHLIEHIKGEFPQGTFGTGKFLEACEKYARSEIKEEDLIAITVKLGFNNVVDAFHNVSGVSSMPRFFTDERKTATKGIILTDELLQLSTTRQSLNLPIEIEARWRLVETAWSLKISRSLLNVRYDEQNHALFINSTNKRINITSSRDALNGYQKGNAFIVPMIFLFRARILKLIILFPM